MPETRIIASSISLAAGSVGDAQVDAGNPLGVTKTTHLHRSHTNFDLAIGGTPAAREEIVFVAARAGTIRDFGAALNDTGTSTNVSFDLKKNGVSVLSAAVNFTHADTDRTTKNGTISSAALVAGDVLSISLAVTASTGAQGPVAWVEISEGA